MSVFISWSGEHSKDAAALLKEWLENVIQSSDPWMSDEDIAAGSRPLEEIKVSLERSSAGIICITPGNWSKPWINYEAGALANSHKSEYVMPVIFGTDISEIVGPITQFQAVQFSPEGMQKVARSVNRSLGENGVTQATVDRACDKWWPALEAKVNQIDFSGEAPKEQRNTGDMVREILHHVREISNYTGSQRAKEVFANKPAYLDNFSQDEIRQINEEFLIPEEAQSGGIRVLSRGEQLSILRGIQAASQAATAALHPHVLPPQDMSPPPPQDRMPSKKKG